MGYDMSDMIYDKKYIDDIGSKGKRVIEIGLGSVHNATGFQDAGEMQGQMS